MGCSCSKLDGLPAVALCRDRCSSLEETLRRSYALADAHSAYLLSLNTVGPALHRFFDQAVESPPDADTEADESPDTSSPESSSSPCSVSSSDSDLPPKFDSDCEEDGNASKSCDLFRCPTLEDLNPKEPFPESIFYSLTYESGAEAPPPPPPPPPTTNAWDFINFFESYEIPYTANANDLNDIVETTRCNEEDKSTKEAQKKKKVPICQIQEKMKAEEEKKHVKISEKKKNRKKSAPRDSKDHKVSLHLSEVTKQLQEMFKKASEAGNDVSNMFDTSRFRYYQKSSVYQGNVQIP